MDWIRFYTSYHDDEAVAAAGEPAEILFVRAMSYSGRKETGGFISDAAAKILTPTRTKARADALCRVGLWTRDDERGGWQMRSWKRLQEAADSLAARRKSDRERQQRRRDAAKEDAPPDSTPPNSSRDDPRDSTRDDHGSNGHASRDNHVISRDPAPAHSRERDRDRARVDRDLEPGDHYSGHGASVDAHEPDTPAERTAAQRLVARYADGVRLADAGQAMRTVSDALAEGVPEQLIDGGIGVLIAEQSSCTRGRLRVALLKAEGNWGPSASATKPGNPYLDDLRDPTLAAGDSDAPLLWAVPDPPALEAR